MTTRRPTIASLSDRLAAALAAARAGGVDIGGVEVAPDGAIRILDLRAARAEPSGGDEFEQWQNSGRLG